MASQTLTLEVECRLAWWTWLYVYGVRFFCDFRGTVPDLDKAVGVVLSGARFRINGGRWLRLHG